MTALSEALRFEEAGIVRDQIRLVEDAGKFQKVDLATPDENCDVFGLYKGDRHLCLSVLQIREGILLSSRQFIIGLHVWNIAESGRESVLLQWYREEDREVPPEICVPEEGFSPELIEQWFLRELGVSVKVLVPQKGVKRRLADMAEKNARLFLMQKIPVSGLDDIRDLQTLLHLRSLPKSIEAFDISNIGGAFAVAGMVPSNYRRYKIKTVEGQNDFAMMMEAVSRRLSRQQKEGVHFADCLLIDGGLGQLHAALEVIRHFPDAPEVIALAKKEELLYTPYSSEPVRLDATHPVRKLVQRIRDEVHRWALAYHRQLRGRQFKATLLNSIPGIGPKKAITLLRAFGSVSAIKEATAEEIARVEGFSLKAAHKLLEQLHEDDIRKSEVNRGMGAHE
jgi:excinuclease ABC subunit C